MKFTWHPIRLSQTAICNSFAEVLNAMLEVFTPESRVSKRVSTGRSDAVGMLRRCRAMNFPRGPCEAPPPRTSPAAVARRCTTRPWPANQATSSTEVRTRPQRHCSGGDSGPESASTCERGEGRRTIKNALKHTKNYSVTKTL